MKRFYLILIAIVVLLLPIVGPSMLNNFGISLQQPTIEFETSKTKPVTLKSHDELMARRKHNQMVYPISPDLANALTIIVYMCAAVLILNPIVAFLLTKYPPTRHQVLQARKVNRILNHYWQN